MVDGKAVMLQERVIAELTVKVSKKQRLRNEGTVTGRME